MSSGAVDRRSSGVAIGWKAALPARRFLELSGVRSPDGGGYVATIDLIDQEWSLGFLDVNLPS